MRSKLTECGWKDQMKAHCKGETVYQTIKLLHVSSYNFFFFAEVIKEKGLEHVTVEDLVVEITPKGRGTATENHFNTGAFSVIS